MTRTLLLITTAAAALAAAPAWAQDQTQDQAAAGAAASGDDAGSGMSQEVIVTAQKREQTLVDVPQSVSVITGASLERNQATSFQDYLKLVPGLQANQSNPGEARLVLRGINTGGVSATVATYVDETPFGSSSALVNGAILAGEFDTFDIARVEVLRGPQGTLYGASSMGGVLKFVTAEPNTTKFEARARGSVESTEGGEMSYMGSALINVPLSETLAVRGSGFYRKYGGFIDSIGTGGSYVQKNVNGTESYGGRVSALYKPSSNFSIRLTAILQDLNNDAGNVVDTDPQTLQPLYGRLTQSIFVPQFTDVAYRLYTGTVTADLGFGQLVSATSYSTLHETLRDDFTTYYGALLGLYSDATGPAAAIGLDQQTNTDRFTQELRLSGEAGDVFEWLVGGYYTHEKGALLQTLTVFDKGTLTPTAAFPVYETILPGFPLLADLFLRSRYEEFAGFANGTLHLGPRFDLTFGGRYSHNDQTARQGGSGPLAPPAASAKSDEGVFTWSVAPKFKFSDTGAIYARVAKGFRPGGPNVIPPIPAGDPVPPATFKSDSLISYEVGVKAETSDRKFSIDIAAFHIDWNDVQLFALFGAYGINANGGKAKSDGVEFTATARPARGVNFSLNGAYTNARLAADTDPVAVGGRDGDKLPFVPRWSVSANGDYEWALGARSTAYLGGSVRFVSEQSGNYSPQYLATFGDQVELPSFAVADLRAGIDFDRFSVEVYAKNVTNSVGVTSFTYTQPGSYPFGAGGAGVIRPRTVGVTLGAGF